MLSLLGRFTWFNFFATLASLAVIAFFVFPARSFAQAFIAYKMGDPTAKYQGRMTFNPLVHMDKFGIAVLFLCGLGFVKPVPTNPRNFRNPRRGIILTSLAGPAMGLLMGFLGVAAFRIAVLFMHDMYAIASLQYLLVNSFALLNIELAILTLLPIPFFDGYQILSLFLPGKWLYWVESNSMMISMFVLILLVSGVIWRPLSWLSVQIVNGMLAMVGF